MSMTDDQLYNLYKKHWNVYSYEFDGVTFYFRELSRKEYREVIEFIPDELDREEWVCKICVIEPENYDYENSKGGLVTSLSKKIIVESGFSNVNTGKINALVEKYMDEMNSFQNQISCIISEAFPNLDLEAIEDFPLEKTLWYYSRARYKLEALRGMELTTVNNEEATKKEMMRKQMQEQMRQVQSQGNYEDYEIEPMEEPIPVTGSEEDGVQMSIDGNPDGGDAPELAAIRAFMQGKNI